MALRRRLLGRAAKSVLWTGLRGVGKTVLLNEFAKTALRLPYEHEHIEADENIHLFAEVASTMHRILLRLSATHRLTERTRRALGTLKAFGIQIPEPLRGSWPRDPNGIAGPPATLAADCQRGAQIRATPGRHGAHGLARQHMPSGPSG